MNPQQGQGKDERPLFVVGDIHGQYDAARELLHQGGLVNADGGWAGGDARLWFMGDLIDRGPKGVETVEWVMQLEREAQAAGGSANALLGNHEVMFLAARTFSTTRPISTAHNVFRTAWLKNGGTERDWFTLNDKHLAWMRSRPALVIERARLDGYDGATPSPDLQEAATKDDSTSVSYCRALLMHADALFYTHYGDSITEINAAIRETLHSKDETRFGLLFDQFIERLAFLKNDPKLSADGTERATYLLQRIGADLLIHGHTPIQYLRHGDANDALVYAGGRVVNVDGGLYLGGKGFIVRVDSADSVVA